MRRTSLINALLKSANPSIRWKVLTGVQQEVAASPNVKRLQNEIRLGPVAAALLAHRDASGRMRHRYNVYDKWQGAHWTLAALADIGYPAGDMSLWPICDQILQHWLGKQFFCEFEARSNQHAWRGHGVPVMQGRHRRCASQQGSALLSLTRLGLADVRAEQLIERLLHWQWPDGGWNCDKNPNADTSSFMETILPMRALAAHARATGDAKAKRAARRAANVFLERNLYRRRADDTIIHADFIKLHYPLYWHYDILGGLKAMVELGLIKDARCGDALDLLEEKELSDGGWAAEKRYFKLGKKRALGADNVNWGGTSKLVRNEWITADALSVLHAAGRV